jgi:hypothetical protein
VLKKIESVKIKKGTDKSVIHGPSAIRITHFPYFAYKKIPSFFKEGI